MARKEELERPESPRNREPKENRMFHFEKIACPHCADQVRIELDLTRGVSQHMVAPCGTCRTPIALEVEIRDDDTVRIRPLPH